MEAFAQFPSCFILRATKRGSPTGICVRKSQEMCADCLSSYWQRLTWAGPAEAAAAHLRSLTDDQTGRHAPALLTKSLLVENSLFYLLARNKNSFYYGLFASF